MVTAWDRWRLITLTNTIYIQSSLSSNVYTSELLLNVWQIKLNEMLLLPLDLILPCAAAVNRTVNKANLQLTTLWETSWCSRAPCSRQLHLMSGNHSSFMHSHQDNKCVPAGHKTKIFHVYFIVMLDFQCSFCMLYIGHFILFYITYQIIISIWIIP